MISPMLVPNIKPKNRNPENRGSDGKVHQVLHDVAGVLGAGKPGFHHSKSSLHEKYERDSHENPNGVHR